MELPHTPTLTALLELATMHVENFEVALQQILRIDSHALGVERVSYWSIHPDPSALFCELGYISSLRTYERGRILLESECRPYFAEVHKASVINVKDALTDPRTRDLEQYLLAHGIASLLDVPIMVRGRAVAILCHEHVGSPRVWLPSEVEFATSIGQCLTLVLETRARVVAEQAERRALFLADASYAHETLDITGVADRAVRAALPTLGEMALIYLLDERGEIGGVSFAHTDPARRAILQEVFSRRLPERAGPMFAARVLRSRESLLIPVVHDDLIDLHSPDSEVVDITRALEIRSLMGIPLQAQGELFGVMVFSSSERFYGQDDLRLADDYAKRVGAALENARLFARAQQAIRSRDELLNIVSHQLNTPLASLLVASEALASRSPGMSQQATARMSSAVVEQARRIRRLSNHIFDAAEIMLGGPMLRRETADLTSIVKGVVESIAAADGNACPIDLRTNGPVVGAWDPSKVEDVVRNLLDNALEHGAGRPIEILVDGKGGKALLIVRDHGVGIEPELLAHIFDRFEHGESARTPGGLGLGLYIVRGIVEAHGGTVSAKSLDDGTEFVIELPRAPIGAPAGESAPAGEHAPRPHSG